MDDTLIRQVRSNPHDKAVAGLFCTTFEAAQDHDRSAVLTYLQLKCLDSPERWGYFNDIASIYRNAGKNRIAFMCFIASLAENPFQPAIVELAESMEKSAGPIMTHELKDDKCMVSVIMPTYNRTAEIKDSIQSVLSQSFKDIELVIVNDGGNDRVKEVVDSFRSAKIKYYKLSRNKGLAGALNEGVLQAEGRYVAYLDDDDVYYEDHLSKLVRSLEKRASCDLIYSNAYWCFGDLKGDKFVERSRKLLGRRPRRFDRELLFRENYISTLNLLHKKECFKKCGMFNEDLPVCMDWELWMRFSLECNMYQLNDITGEYRFKENNMSKVDELNMSFFPGIIRRYMQSYFGKTVFLKHYILNRQKEKAEAIFHALLSKYGHLTLKAKKELFSIAKTYRFRKSKSIFRDLALDYFSYKAKLWGRSLSNRFRRKELYC